MSGASRPPVTLLPPPTATILLFAADGLAAWKKNFSAKGFPRTPERAIWVPMFRELVNSDEGMLTLHVLSRSGMQAWRCPPDTINSLQSAFRDITLRALIIATLDDFADTGFVRVLMPPLPSRPQAPTPTPTLTPRPESAARKPTGSAYSSPRRPTMQPKRPPPKPV